MSVQAFKAAPPPPLTTRLQLAAVELRGSVLYPDLSALLEEAVEKIQDTEDNDGGHEGA